MSFYRGAEHSLINLLFILLLRGLLFMKRKTNEEFVSELMSLNNGIIALDQYINNKIKIRFQCKYGHMWATSPLHVLRGHGCPYCEGKMVVAGKTDLWTTRPDVAMLLKDKEDGYQYSYGSHQKVDFVCPNCHSILYKEIKSVCQQGLGCKHCSDHISYPNKLIRAVLQCTDVINIDPEWSPEWIGQHRYDIYFEHDNQSYVVEMDGGLGHGNREIRSNSRLTSKEVDAFKDAEAIKHNIILIRIDCNYELIDRRFEYIKQNILQSRLAEIVDLSNVDWDSCNNAAMSSYITLVSKLFNEGRTVQDISNLCDYCTSTIRQWLYQAEKIGLCNCAAIHGTKRGTKPYKVQLHQYTLSGDYVATFESATAAHNATGVLCEYICKSYKYYKPAGGYLWFAASDPTQPDQTRIIPNTLQND